MERVYTVCMAVGIGIPLLSLIAGGIGDAFGGLLDGVSGLFEGLDIDFDPSIDIGDNTFCLMPFSVQSICAGLLIYGTIGKMVYNGYNGVTVNIIGAAAGYLAAIAVQTLIRRLKKVEHTTYPKEQLLLYDGKVVNTILKGGFGSVSITTLDGITGVYPAKAENEQEAIRQGTIVSIVRFDKNVMIVKVKDELIKKYETAE